MQYRQSSPRLIRETLKSPNKFTTGEAFGTSIAIAANHLNVT